ncbi:PhoH family protein [candidate division WOR-3 bacterium]|nr:PhoH family protein [candidate division WOR-3 bacterium]
MAETSIYLPNEWVLNFVGPRDDHLRILRSKFDCKFFLKGEKVIIRGEEKTLEHASKAVKELINLIEEGFLKDEKDFLDFVENGGFSDGQQKTVINTPCMKIFPRSNGQKLYIGEIEKNELTICIGPAGTGKTFLAVAKAVEMMVENKIKKIILTRPAVEAGENLGYLPGDLIEKVQPYLRPLYDSLEMTLSKEKMKKYIDFGIIEVAPLAFMRGRTLNEAFIILDEAQNTTHPQLKMFLTRLGRSSKTVVCGDITQSDLITGKPGLVEIRKLLGNIDGIGIIQLTSKDVVRHRLVKEIIKAYEGFNENQ